MIKHRITWYNPINTYGIITWICIGSLILVIIACILKNIISYKKDKQLLDEIATKYDKTTLRHTVARTTMFDSEKYNSERCSEFDCKNTKIDDRPLMASEFSEENLK